MDFDIVVVGGGTAGCAVAARLIENTSAKVALIEAGSDYGTLEGKRWPPELLDATRLPLTHLWGYTTRANDGRHISVARAMVMGGCSAHNGCTQSWGWRGDYDAWGSVSPGWDSVAMEQALRASAKAMRVRHFKDEEIQPFQQAFLEACVSSGTPRTDDLDVLDGGVGVSVNPVNVVDGVRINSSVAYLDGVRDNPRFKVISAAMVNTVLLEGNKVVGVSCFYNGRLTRVTAPTVVLAGGVCGSPEILLRSGVGEADGLRALGVSVKVDLRGVGRNLHDHPALIAEFEGTHELAQQLTAFGKLHWTPDEQTVAKLDSGASKLQGAPYDLHVYPYVEPDPFGAAGWRVCFPVALLRPRSRGQLSLQSPEPLVRAKLETNYLHEEADVTDLLNGFERLEDIIRQPALAPLLGKRLTSRPPKERNAAVTWARATHRHYWHPAGTCRMGPNPDAGDVVDHHCKVYGTDGLYVVDGAIFPEVPRSTPALPTVALGERFALGFRSRWTA
jgi:choline dehydrogenase